MKYGLAALAGALCLSASPASALVFNFTFAATGQNGMGTFTTSDTAQNVGGRTAYTITGISGTVNGLNITSLLAPGSFLSNDNLLYTTGVGFFDAQGVGYVVNGSTNSNLYYTSVNSSYRLTTTNPFSATFPTVTVTPASAAAVPEPATWAMMILGFALVGATARRRRRTLLAA